MRQDHREEHRERVEHIFRFMEYDVLTQSQLNLIESYERQYMEGGYLTPRQMEVLESIFKQAAEKA